MTDDDGSEDLSPAAPVRPAVAATLPMGAADGERITESPAPRDAMVELNALLGRGTRYAGKLSFEGRIRVEGQFEGDIRGEVLVIGAGAEIEGDIEVQVCIVTGGQVRANIRARDAIELHAPATVEGDLHAPNIFIDRGVQFEGNCKMAPLGEDAKLPAPDAEEHLRAASAPNGSDADSSDAAVAAGSGDAQPDDATLAGDDPASGISSGENVP